MDIIKKENIKNEKNNKEQLFAEERKSKILELLKESDKLVVPELCDYFKVSPATIRNDLRELANAGMLKRTHGGALSNTKTGFELDSSQKSVDNLKHKQSIARRAIDLIEDGDTIALDTGTTTLELARLLSQKKDITVVTNDIEIARMLEDKTSVNVILAGGTLRRNYHCTMGPMAIKALEGLRLDKAFIAANGLTIKHGLTTPDINMAEMKKEIIAIANEAILLCDSSKYGNVTFAHFADLKSIDRIIIDNGIGEKDLEDLKATGLRVDAVS